MIDLKASVDLSGVRPELLVGIMVVAGVFQDFGVPLTITAVRNGQHMEGSLHYKGLAVDIRLASRYTTHPDTDGRVHLEAKKRLGSQFDFLLETDHFHLEWDPKTPVAPNV